MWNPRKWTFWTSRTSPGYGPDKKHHTKQQHRSWYRFVYLLGCLLFVFDHLVWYMWWHLHLILNVMENVFLFVFVCFVFCLFVCLFYFILFLFLFRKQKYFAVYHNLFRLHQCNNVESHHTRAPGWYNMGFFLCWKFLLCINSVRDK